MIRCKKKDIDAIADWYFRAVDGGIKGTFRHGVCKAIVPMDIV